MEDGTSVMKPMARAHALMAEATGVAVSAQDKGIRRLVFGLDTAAAEGVSRPILADLVSVAAW